MVEFTDKRKKNQTHFALPFQPLKTNLTDKESLTMETKRLSSLLKLIANPDRMTILFMLLDSERSIAELSEALGQPATAVSNHLARLRSEGLIDFTRYHRIIEYRLVSEEAAAILNTLRHLENRKAA
jgi:transcriptional regulator, arsR family protein